MPALTFFGKTDMGLRRTNNEDTFHVDYLHDSDHLLALVVDGVGGYEGGEIAADIALRTILASLATNNEAPGDTLPTDCRRNFGDALLAAVTEANNAIFRARREMRSLADMSCVLTAVIIDVPNMTLHMAHVGDTRLYRYLDRQIAKLSHDHTLVGYREEIGELTETEAMNHPDRNVIGKDLGSQPLDADSGYIETASFPLLPGCELLLCSDGLYDMITSARIAADMSVGTPEQQVETLIADAVAAGGCDNVTAIVISFNPQTLEIPCCPAPSYPETPTISHTKPRCRKITLTLLLFAAVALLLSLLMPDSGNETTIDKPATVVIATETESEPGPAATMPATSAEIPDTTITPSAELPGGEAANIENSEIL